MADALDVLRREPAPARPDPRFAVALRRRLEQELDMAPTDGTTTSVTGAIAMVHLGVADADRAMRFYGPLFGWEAERVELDGHVRHYVTNTTGVQPVLVGEPGYPEVRLGFHVDDPAAARATVESLGGTVESVDPEAGRWFLASDPAGTPIVCWRPDGRYDDRKTWAPVRGELQYFQIDVPDAGPVLPFYAGLLGWAFEDNPAPDYVHVAGHAAPVANGIQSAAPEARVRLFFEVGDLDAGEALVRSLGGTVGERYEWGPMEAVACTDDQGTRFVLSVTARGR